MEKKRPKTGKAVAGDMRSIEYDIRQAAERFTDAIVAIIGRDKLPIPDGVEIHVPTVEVERLSGLREKATEATGIVPIPPAGFKAEDFETLYRQIKNRLIDEARIDPILLQLLTDRPEIVVAVEPRIVELKGNGLKGRIARLLAAGFLGDTRKQVEINRELDRTGGQVNSGNLGRALADFVTDGFLSREADGFRLAAGVKVSEREVEAV